jgi:hypothetical protein
MNINLLLSILVIAILAVGLLFSKHLHKNIKIYVFSAFFASGILSEGLAMKASYAKKLEVKGLKLVQINTTNCDPRTDDKCNPGDDDEVQKKSSTANQVQRIKYSELTK